ncbi:hypothetical protein [Dubosiella muris]|uniref:Uncharacterized protein n=1 Tax=Dubosiella muris TaxID=3038133 RepID=A0AC61R9F0_9FIRM|nr:hypothetical protein [Dubosiella muris]TGY66864.1 hypothetical protein E5336_01910 [Dubosiella muris]
MRKIDISKLIPWVLLVLLLIFRVWLGEKVGNQFYASQVYDDQLLIRYAYLPSHFFEPNIDSLLKTMSYPLFLSFVKVSGLSYTFVLSCVWCCTALYFGSVFYRISDKNKIIGWVSFAYILFFPTAFELWQGTRLYRNAIIAPFVIMLFSYLLIITWKNIKSKISYLDIIISIIFGVLFSFTYYIKEDGLWILACLLFAILVNTIIEIIKFVKNRRGKRFTMILLTIWIPIFVFIGITGIYKCVNNYYFGVSEVETRNGGNLGEFVSLIYKIESTDRNNVVWAPKDAVDKAWNASPTLQKMPDLYESITHTPWYSQDIEKHPIQGDFLTWVLRTALNDTGRWTNEREVDALFNKVNEEIKDAFDKGELQKDSRIQLLSSAGGKSIQEILNLNPLIVQEYIGAVQLNGYESGAGAVAEVEPREIAEAGRNLTHISYLTDYSKKEISGVVIGFINIVFMVYSIINTLLFISVMLGIILFLIILVKQIKEKSIGTVNVFLGLGCLIFLGISFAYAFAIAWFSDFLFVAGIQPLTLNFYSIGLPAILSFSYFTNLVNVYFWFKRRKTI